MYINKIDDLIDRILDDFNQTVILSDARISKILKENNFNTVLAGGIAGVTCWTSSYWADVLNTHVMTGSTIKQVIKTLVFKDYFRGILVCIPRAFIINATGYYFYEISKRHLS